MSGKNNVFIKKGTQVKVDDPDIVELQNAYGRMILDGGLAPAIIVGALNNELAVAVLAHGTVYPKNVFWVSPEKVQICSGMLPYKWVK